MRGQAKIIWIAILALLIGAAAYGVTSYNRLIQLHEQVPEAWSQVENVLQRRNDLIPNLVETVKGYAKHEEKVFGDVSDALKAFSRAQTIPQKIEASNQITSLLGRILAVSVSYPNLKADAQFARLEDELAGTENRIAVERMRYNEAVRAYNSQVKTFPLSALAALSHLPASEVYFKAEENAHTAPRVQF